MKEYITEASKGFLGDFTDENSSASYMK
jgi:hypothetical protein